MKNDLLKYPMFLFGISIMSCMPEGDNSPLERNLRTLQEHEIQTVNASADFAVDLFHQLNKSNNVNQFYSPYSIHVALSMAMNGNEGEVLQEYLDVLWFDGQTLEDANKGAKELTEFLLQVDPKVKMAIANAIWYRQDYQVKVPFRTMAEEYYNAEVAGIDVFDPKSVNIINQWIEQHTEGLIKDMLVQIPPNAVIYLVNAIYYKADWKFQFDPGKTKKEPFHTSPERQVLVDMMSFKEAGTIKAFEGQGFQYLEIPYSTGQYSMGVLLPDGYEVAGVQEQFTSENLALWRSQAVDYNVILKMPKFKLQQKIENMKEDLKEMGLNTPFDFDSRNFTLLFDNPTDSLKISRVIHDAVIEVDEKGSEAAAATVVEGIRLVSTSPSRPIVFAIDRPFIFFIQEKHSGALLFMGKLGDPSLL
jgi:serine protease inhibitor